jgi:hypothetical protein
MKGRHKLQLYESEVVKKIRFGPRVLLLFQEVRPCDKLITP